MGARNRRAVVAVLHAYAGPLGLITFEIQTHLIAAGVDLHRAAIRLHLNALLRDGHAIRGYAPGDGTTYSWRLNDAGRTHYGVTE